MMPFLEMTYRNISQKKGAIWFLDPFLTLASLFFAAFVKVKNLAYDMGLKTPKKAKIPVISIGNVVVGGSGKTPFTLFLAKKLSPYFRLAILSRGYLGKAENGNVVVSRGNGNGPEVTPGISGDEAYLLASNLPEAIVISGKNRFESAKIAKELGATLILLDDGMQHRKLHRDIDIVLVNGKENNFLPKGHLRDEKNRLESADFIVSTKSGNYFSIPHIEIGFRNASVVFQDGTKRKEICDPVAIFCGVANPERFEKAVKQIGASIIAKEFLSDHQMMEPKRLLEFAKRAKDQGAKCLLCTEKDWVKLEKIPLDLPIGFVKQEILITKNHKVFDTLIRNIIARSTL